MVDAVPNLTLEEHRKVLQLAGERSRVEQKADLVRQQLVKLKDEEQLLTVQIQQVYEEAARRNS